jgi:hypothetical protein
MELRETMNNSVLEIVDELGAKKRCRSESREEKESSLLVDESCGQERQQYEQYRRELREELASTSTACSSSSTMRGHVTPPVLKRPAASA